MSETQPRVSLADLDNPICEFCGFEIEDRDLQCYARGDGEVCAP
ncbi:hypothetical protein [Haloglomus halophilum]|nr:hypothetical protein [Haloglomus halophilum]